MILTKLLTSRRVDLLLAVAVTVAAATGLASWAVGTGWARWVTVVHALAGLSLLALTPAKIRGSVRTGLKRRRATRWLSMLLGALVVATVVLGVLHATGLWHGVGYWTALWTHVLLAALLGSAGVMAHREPAGPSPHNRSRSPCAGGRRCGAGGRGRYLRDPAVGRRRQPAVHRLPRDRLVQPVGDAYDHVAQRPDAPRVPTSGWEPDHRRRAGGARSLCMTRGHDRVQADLDCTGGWWSRQSWDAVPLVRVDCLLGLPTCPPWKSRR